MIFNIMVWSINPHSLSTQTIVSCACIYLFIINWFDKQLYNTRETFSTVYFPLSFIICTSLWLHPIPWTTSTSSCFCFLSMFVCWLNPSIPLGHQPGSLFHQCHPFPSKSRCLHTKLPICTLPAFCGPYGRRGPQDHAPPARRASTLRRPTRSLPAGPHRLPTWLPR